MAAWWQAQDHPIWGLARIALLVCAALVLGYANSSHFDSGEVITVLGSMGLARLAR